MTESPNNQRACEWKTEFPRRKKTLTWWLCYT